MSRYWEEIEDERKVTNKLQESNYFEEGPDLLIRNIATKVQGTQEIEILCVKLVKVANRN